MALQSKSCDNTAMPVTSPTHASLHTEWRFVAASVRGRSHERTASGCQDAYAWERLSQHRLVAAVADGAGSAKFGEVGATIASRIAVKAVSRQMGVLQPGNALDLQGILARSVRVARLAVRSEATRRDVEARELATTLILVVAEPEYVFVAQVGDGAVVVGDEQGDLFSVTSPQTGEYLNETVFLTASDAMRQMQHTCWHGTPSCLAAFSDGLQMLALKMPQAIPHAPFFAPLFHFVSHMSAETPAQDVLLSFLSSSRIRERTDDDVTLFLAHLEK